MVEAAQNELAQNKIIPCYFPHDNGVPMKTLVATAMEKILLKTSGDVFLTGVQFLRNAGMAPERVSIMLTTNGKYILTFHALCDIRPFAANYSTFARVLRGLVHIRAWKLKSIEFVAVKFTVEDIPHLQRAVEKTNVELVLLRNCTYALNPGPEAIALLHALNKSRKALVCEYGDHRLSAMVKWPPPQEAPGQPAGYGQVVVQQELPQPDVFEAPQAPEQQNIAAAAVLVAPQQMPPVNNEQNVAAPADAV